MILSVSPVKYSPAKAASRDNGIESATIHVVRMLPRRTSPVLRCRIQRRDHPGGYEIEGLGPPPRMG